MVHEFDDERVEVDSLDEVTLDRLREATVVLPAETVPSPTEWDWELSESALSFPKGSDAVYRGVYRGEDVQVRVYEDRYTVQRDHANPAEAPLRHFLLDVPPRWQAVVFGALLLVVLALGWALAR